MLVEHRSLPFYGYDLVAFGGIGIALSVSGQSLHILNLGHLLWILQSRELAIVMRKALSFLVIAANSPHYMQYL